MSQDKTVAVAFCTCPPDHAERLARFLVENSHAACVSIVSGVKSVYRWKGKVEEDGESLLVIKFPRERVTRVTSALAAEHPYDVPEIVAFSVDSGLREYLDWVLDTTRDPG